MQEELDEVEGWLEDDRREERFLNLTPPLPEAELAAPSSAKFKALWLAMAAEYGGGGGR